MARTLFVTIGRGDEVQVRRVPMNAATQTTVEQLFETQEEVFREGIDEEHEFTGSYTPDPNELLYLDNLPEARRMAETVEGNALAIEALSEAELRSGNVRSLFAGRTEGGGSFIGVQNFQRSQVLIQGRVFLFSGDTYTELTEPGLMIGASIASLVVNGRLKFSQLGKAKRIFDLTELVREATDPEVQTFGSHLSISVENLDQFVGQADQTVRKKIYQIGRSGVLEQYTVPHIADAAAQLGMALTVAGGRIVIPPEKTEMKKLINFLDDGIYRSGMTDRLYYANSKRPLA